MLTKIIIKIVAAVAGRTIGHWLRRLRPSAKKKMISSLKRRRFIFLAVALGLLAILAEFYLSHIKTAPITGRRRLIILTGEHLENNSDVIIDQLKEILKSKIYGKTDSQYLRVEQIAKRLVEANPEIQPFEKWKLIVVNDAIVGAFALANSCVVLFNGIMQLANTNDQLALIVGHEMAHIVLGHPIEELNYGLALDVFTTSCIAAIWMVIPTDSTALITHGLYGYIVFFTLELPHKRQMETEADKVGLIFSARACYDVREGSILWQKMDSIRKLKDTSLFAKLPEFFQTHPDSLKRAQNMDSQQDKAEKWRNENKCPALPDKDPRDDFKLSNENEIL